MASKDVQNASTFRSFAIGCAAAITLFAVPAFADVKTGVDAWSAGDYDRAVAEWQGPAANGDPDALFNLAQAYRLGRGVEANVARARELYQAAAERGHVKAADNFGLLLFQQGEQQRAMPLIREAATRGDPRAQYILGLAHFNADYAEKDWVRAYALMTLASSAGLPQATSALTQMDEYVPLSQRQEAQLLARQIEAESESRRAAELAAADLSRRQPAAQPAVQPAAAQPAAPQPAVSTPVRTAARQTPAPAPAQAPDPAPAVARASGNWGVQLGAFGVAGNADRLWARLSTNPALEGTRKALVAGGSVTRLRAVGFASRADAQAACNTLKRQGQSCIVSNPS